MIFKNAVIFKIDKKVIDAMAFIETNLREMRLKPIEPSQASVRGFVPPGISLEDDAVDLTKKIGDYIFLTLGGEDKILPAAAIRLAVAKEIFRIESATGAKLTSSNIRQLRGDVEAEMLRVALVKPYRLDAFIDLKNSVLVANASSTSRAEALVSELRAALGFLPAQPIGLLSGVGIRDTMTGWLSNTFTIPKDVHLGNSCLLESGDKESAKFSHQDITGEEVEASLESGKRVKSIDLVYNKESGFSLSDDLAIKKFKMFDAEIEPGDDGVRDTEHFLMANAISFVYLMIKKAFKIDEVAK